METLLAGVVVSNSVKLWCRLFPPSLPSRLPTSYDRIPFPAEAEGTKHCRDEIAPKRRDDDDAAAIAVRIILSLLSLPQNDESGLS